MKKLFIKELPDVEVVQNVANDLLQAANDAGLWWHNFEAGGIALSCPFCLNNYCRHRRDCSWGLTYDWKKRKIKLQRYGRVPCGLTESDFCECLGYNENLLHAEFDQQAYWQERSKMTDEDFKMADLYLMMLDRNYDKERSAQQRQKEKDRQALLNRRDPSSGRR